MPRRVVRRAPAPADARPDDGVEAWPFVAPMVVFLVFVFLGGFGDAWNIWAYVGRTVIVGAMLVWLWPRVRVDVQWTHLGLGTLVGVIGLVQWVGTDKLLQAARNQFPDDWAWGGVWSLLISGVRPGDEAFNPVTSILEPAGLLAFVAFVVIRTIGPTVVVAVMEELFWRNWLWRSLIAPANWRLARVGDPELIGWLGTSLAFSLVHPQRLVSVIWALLIAWLLLKTKSIGACIVAHGVTNLLLAAYVLIMTLGLGYESEWYFW